MGSLIRVSKKSKGAEKRLYKSVRLMILYRHKAENHCWRKKTSARYMVAYHWMSLYVIRQIFSVVGGFKWWTCEAVGSRKAIDLEYDRDLAFLIHVSNHQDMT